MKSNIYRQKKLKELKKKALTLYKEGLNVYEVGKLVGRSHTWVWLLVKKELPNSAVELPPRRIKKLNLK